MFVWGKHLLLFDLCSRFLRVSYVQRNSARVGKVQNEVKEPHFSDPDSPVHVSPVTIAAVSQSLSNRQELNGLIGLTGLTKPK